MMSKSQVIYALSESKAQLKGNDLVIRSYKLGDEIEIVNLLNSCFGYWGTLQKWKALYQAYPTFKGTDVFIIEKNERIIGHETLRFRDLATHDNISFSTASLSDAAIDPDQRGKGLHNELMSLMLEAAKSKGASLVFSWYLRDSGLHKHSERLGFIEVRQASAYMKVMRPQKLLRSGLMDFLNKSPGLKSELEDLDNLFFRINESTFSVAELVDRTTIAPVRDQGNVEITFTERSLSTLVNLRNMTKRQRLFSLISLFVLRRAKIRFSSLSAFINLARKGLSLAKSV